MTSKFLILATALLLSGCATSRLTVQWTDGEVAVGVGEKYFHSVGWIEGVELGLRSDGVLVYRPITKGDNDE